MNHKGIEKKMMKQKETKSLLRAHFPSILDQIRWKEKITALATIRDSTARLPSFPSLLRLLLILLPSLQVKKKVCPNGAEKKVQCEYFQDKRRAGGVAHSL